MINREVRGKTMSVLRAVAQGIVRGSVAAAVVVLVSMAGVDAGDLAPHRFPVTLDRSRILETAGTITKVSVTNPRIADVTVLSPTSILVNAKGVGVTSLLIFSGANVNAFDVVVRPGPVAQGPAPVVPDSEVHNVIVQRADKVTDHVFVRDGQKTWMELGDVKPANEAAKK
jgi:Flp pilus assembly secretin CpaC